MSFLSGLKAAERDRMKGYICFALAILSVAIGLTFSGCKTVTAAPTPGVTQFYSQAALVINDFSGVLVQAQQIVTTVHAEGLMNDADYKNAQTTFRAVAQQGENVVALLKVGGDQAVITSQINALIAQVGNMPSAFGIKNPQSAQQFTALTLAMQNILRASLTLVGPSTSTRAAADIPVGMPVFDYVATR